MNQSCLPKLIIKMGKKLSDDQAVTLTEVIVSLILISTVMITLFRLSSTLIPALEEDRRRALVVRQERILYRILTQELPRIKPPWWLSHYEMIQRDDHWEFPWYGGREEIHLILSNKETSLHIDSAHNPPLILKNMNIREIELLSTREGTPALVKISFFLVPSVPQKNPLRAKAESKSIYLPLGSRIIPGAKLP